jgi:stage III sporulation protein AH
MAKRQTIWLSTMMVLSLMLIGFYTVNNNVEPVNTDPAQVSNQETGGDQEASATDKSDFFIKQHMEAEERFSKRVEELNKIITTAKDASEVEKAKKELESLNNNDQKMENAIELITAEGYPDAIIEMKDDKYHVTVQAQELNSKQAVKIMGIVAQEMSVSQSKVTVEARN